MKGTNSMSEISTVPPAAEIAAVTGTHEQTVGFNEDDEAKEHNDEAQDNDHSVNTSGSSEYSDNPGDDFSFNFGMD